MLLSLKGAVVWSFQQISIGGEKASEVVKILQRWPDFLVTGPPNTMLYLHMSACPIKSALMFWGHCTSAGKEYDVPEACEQRYRRPPMQRLSNHELTEWDETSP